MEDLFEILVVAVIFIVTAIAKSNKNKKKVADKPAQAPAPVTEPAKPIRTIPKSPNLESAFAVLTELLEDDDLPDPDRPAPAPVKAREQTSIEAETAMKQRADLIRTRIQESLSGESHVDDHGCIGGSMPDHEAEGEALAEHAMHEKNRAERLKAEANAVRAEDLRRPTAADLRKAVVMSEILNKPVSLRKGRI